MVSILLGASGHQVPVPVVGHPDVCVAHVNREPLRIEACGNHLRAGRPDLDRGATTFRLCAYATGDVVGGQVVTGGSNATAGTITPGLYEGPSVYVSPDSPRGRACRLTD
jgi:hypothetical protein